MPTKAGRAYALELLASYPARRFEAANVDAIATALDDIGLDHADDILSLLRVHSSEPPSIAQVYQAAREARQDTMSPPTIDHVYLNGVECRCGETHGHMLPPQVIAHGLHHLRRWSENGSTDELARAKSVELGCDCGYGAVS